MIRAEAASYFDLGRSSGDSTLETVEVAVAAATAAGLYCHQESSKTKKTRQLAYIVFKTLPSC